MTSNGVAFSDLGDPPTHQNHGLYPGRDSCWTLVGDKRVMTGVLRRMLFTRCRVCLRASSSLHVIDADQCGGRGAWSKSSTWNRLSWISLLTTDLSMKCVLIVVSRGPSRLRSPQSQLSGESGEVYLFSWLASVERFLKTSSPVRHQIIVTTL